jgi:hypothetical protein
MRVDPVISIVNAKSDDIADGDGMQDAEMLRVLANCLKGSRSRVYDNEMKLARRDNSDVNDPRKVYDKIKRSLMRFRETDEERQMRVLQEFNELTKGKMTADQFESAWVSAITELEVVGLGMNRTALLLAYLQRLDPNTRYDIPKDRRAYRREDGDVGGSA